jgi:hypothetical protein
MAEAKKLSVAEALAQAERIETDPVGFRADST